MIRQPRRSTVLATLLLGALVASAGGCGFDRQWRKMAREPGVEANDGLAGRWVGTWNSERSNHKGTLRAIITPVDKTTYRAHFDATYLGLLRFGYSMNLSAQPDDAGHIRFMGEEDIGALAGGLYRYEGTTDGRTFESAYQSKNDQGRFHMTRPAARSEQ